MLKRKTNHQTDVELICIEELVAPDPLLRKIGQAIEFSFIYDKVEHLYCADNGRPPVDPVMLFMATCSASVPSGGWSRRLNTIRRTAGSWGCG